VEALASDVEDRAQEGDPKPPTGQVGQEPATQVDDALVLIVAPFDPGIRAEAAEAE
jgi:hypothetical protein